MPDSLRARRRELELREQLLRADPANMARSYDLVRAERAVGRNESILGNREAAAPLFASAYSRVRALNRHDPRNQNWLLQRTKLECDWLLGEPGRPPTITPVQLRQAASAAVATLAGNPNLHELANCLPAIGPRRPAQH
jgi:hypothetical protein